ncbi:hypothetical protein QTP88_011805 [Uroleucon formosanum]
MVLSGAEQSHYFELRTLRRADNSLASTNKEKADILAEELSDVFKPHFIPTPASHTSLVMESLQSTIPMALPTKPTSPVELVSIIKKLANNKPPGHNLISNSRQNFASQEQLGLPTESLIQSCKTRWNSIFMMLDRLYKNRCPISNVLADRSMTTAAMAHKFEVTEHQWTDVETLIKLLKPLQIMTTVFCGEKYCSSSMVRPLLNAVIQKHLKHDISDDEISEHFKTTVIRELSDRFKLLWCPSSVVTARQIASFLDPRFKDLEHEPVEAREEIRTRVKNLINEVAEISCDVQIESPVTKHHGALEFLFGDEVNSNTSDSDVQYQNYLAEPQLKFDFDALEWWKTRASKYPLIVELAKKYLGIPATSVSSERCFSTAGNIVTAKRSCLAPETVNMLVFLYQNKQLL